MKRFLLLTALLFALVFQAGAREVYNLNSRWKFYTYDQRDSTMVNLPHTWNRDALSGNRAYYRGTGNYMKYLDVKPQWRGKRVFVKFYGSNSVTLLMVNNKCAGEHRGGGNAFVFEITDLLNYGGTNLLWIAVNNSESADVLPTGGRGNSYGGVFRDVELIVTENSLIGMDEYGSDGVQVAVSKVSEERAEGSVKVTLNARASKQVRLDMRITDHAGRLVGEASAKVKAEKGESRYAMPFKVEKPDLWQGTDNPYLYNIAVKLTDGGAVDSVVVETGFRDISIDPNTGFHLNGVSYPLRGVVLYRDRAVYGPAMTTAHIQADIEMILEMGANAVRVAEGSHSREFYRLCDRYGIVVMSDIPFAGSATFEAKGFYDTRDFRANGERQLRESVLQLYNHPSVIAWGLFSEPEMRGDDPIPFIRELAALAKNLDPGRFTAGCSTRDGEVNTITDLIVFNHSFGWDSGRPGDIRIWRDQFHKNKGWNSLKAAVSYCCGGSPNHQSERLARPRKADLWHPENWQTYFHEIYFGALEGDRKFWTLFAGDMFEYGSAIYRYGETPGINDCGLVSFDRTTRKDAFYLYKANWNRSDEFIHITGKRNGLRSETSQTITVYSNLTDVELTVNGVSQGTKNGNKGIFVWDNIVMDSGLNLINALSPDGGISDMATIMVSPEALMNL